MQQRHLYSNINCHHVLCTCRHTFSYFQLLLIHSLYIMLVVNHRDVIGIIFCLFEMQNNYFFTFQFLNILIYHSKFVLVEPMKWSRKSLFLGKLILPSLFLFYHWVSIPSVCQCDYCTV